ncbi:MAG: hypothetical protein WCJ29_06255 [bacterium]
MSNFSKFALLLGADFYNLKYRELASCLEKMPDESFVPLIENIKENPRMKNLILENLNQKFTAEKSQNSELWKNLIEKEIRGLSHGSTLDETKKSP